MAISYATTGFGFVDSQYGTAADATGLKTLVNQVVDKRYHKQVQKKTFFERMGMVGADMYKEGDVNQTAPGLPVIRKTDLQANKGDVIKMGLRRTVTIAHTNGGKVADAQLVDAETNSNFYSHKVSIERWRFGLRGNGGMNEQRNPYEPQGAIFEDQLADAAAQVVDTSLLYAGFAGFAPHLFRVHGISNCVPAAPTNTLYGNDTTLDTTRTIADIAGAGADNVKAITFEVGATMCEQNDYDPVVVNGEPYWVVLISPKAAMVLQQDDRFRNSYLYARERGVDNPLFKYSEFVYNNCIIFKYDKIRTILNGYNPASLTVSNNAITEVAYTGIGGGVASTDLHQTLFLGANAIAYATGLTKTNLVRAENDYGNIIGRATDLIFGASRLRYSADSGGGTHEQGIVMVVNTLVI